MMWPPVKAWTSKSYINGQVHFVAINYGGKLQERWVILMSVIDSSLVVKVSWPQLVNPSNWVCGWENKNFPNPTKVANIKYELINTNFKHASIDSGLTIPITENIIRPWFSINKILS